MNQKGKGHLYGTKENIDKGKGHPYETKTKTNIEKGKAHSYEAFFFSQSRDTRMNHTDSIRHLDHRGVPYPYG